MFNHGLLCLILLVPAFAILKENKRYTPSWYQYEDLDYNDLLKKDIKFNPVPGMTVSGPCEWETKVTRMENRIPRKISEVYCRESGAPCGDNPTFKCQQLTAQMDVGYTINNVTTGTETVVHKRNVNVGIGCGCVQTRPRRIQQFVQMLVEKKRSPNQITKPKPKSHFSFATN